MEMIKEILPTVLVLACFGVAVGIILAVASRLFRRSDERAEATAHNGDSCKECKDCSCAASADGASDTEAPASMCAHVACGGTCQTAKQKFVYSGAADCAAADRVGGGSKFCPGGCLGLGSCIPHCPYGAISIKQGIASVNEKRCRGCGACTVHCPRGLIKLVPKESKIRVSCIPVERGKHVRTYCETGCVGCRICEKSCPAGALKVKNNIPVIDYSKCTECGICAEKCPRYTIRMK